MPGGFIYLERPSRSGGPERVCDLRMYSMYSDWRPPMYQAVALADGMAGLTIWGNHGGGSGLLFFMRCLQLRGAGVGNLRGYHPIGQPKKLRHRRCFFQRIRARFYTFRAWRPLSAALERPAAVEAALRVSRRQKGG